jgi:hypothetical protein
MEAANTFAYYDMAKITVVKSLIIQTPGVPYPESDHIILSQFCMVKVRLS